VSDAEQARRDAANTCARAAQAHRDAAQVMRTRGLADRAQWHREQAVKFDAVTTKLLGADPAEEAPAEEPSAEDAPA